jgi:hypothetical protein
MPSPGYFSPFGPLRTIPTEAEVRVPTVLKAFPTHTNIPQKKTAAPKDRRFNVQIYA